MTQDHGSYPMAPRHFRLFIWAWHILYVGALLLLLLVALAADAAAKPWQAAALASTVLLQVALYFRYVMRLEMWPMPSKAAVVYFGGSMLLWLAQWQLDPRFLWVGWVLIGHMFGMLQPWYAIPGSALIAFSFFAAVRNWNIFEISLGEVFGWISSVVLFLYIYGLSRASIDRSQLVTELQVAQIELEAARHNDVELAALRERERLAREMHDGLGHALVALSVQLEAVQRLYRVDPARASAQMDALKDLTRASMEELRRSLAGLRAAGLAGQSLPQAITKLSAAYEARSGKVVACTIAGDVDHLPPAVSDVLWRVIQEALTNVEKHAHATRVTLDLAVTPQSVTLAICDDGVGLSAPAAALAATPTYAPGTRLGLLGMAERVEGVGGSLQIEPHTPHGLCVKTYVPLQGHPEQTAANLH
jgi:signal transduction histidine kinase